MQILGVPEWSLLAYLCLLLPWMAVQSRAHVRGIESEDPDVRAKAEALLAPGLVRLYVGTLIQLVALGVFAWLVAARWDYDLLGGDAVSRRALVWGTVALGAHLALYGIAVTWRTAEERSRSMSRRLVPRTPSEWAMAVVVVLTTGTLVVAMAVHIVYDLLAMLLSARAIAREGAATEPAATP